MEKNVALTDEKLTEIAWKAIRDNFPPEQLGDAKIELRHSEWPDGSGMVVEVWLMHSNDEYFSNPSATANTSVQMIRESLNFDEDIVMFLYHGYPDAPVKRRKTA